MTGLDWCAMARCTASSADRWRNSAMFAPVLMASM